MEIQLEKMLCYILLLKIYILCSLLHDFIMRLYKGHSSANSCIDINISPPKFEAGRNLDSTPRFYKWGEKI